MTARRMSRTHARRRPAALGLAFLGLAVALTLAACGNGGDPEEPPSPPSPGAETATETATPTPTETAGGMPTATETASPSPTGSETATDPDGPAATAAYTSESGYFTWTFPDIWTASQEEYHEDLLDYLGVPYEEVLFHDPEQTVEFWATTGVGPTDNDGPKPDVVEVLDTEELTDVPVNEGENAYGTGPVCYRAALLQSNDAVEDSGNFDGDEFLLTVHVVNVPEGEDPEATDESFWSAWFYELPPVEGFDQGSANFLRGSISQDTAEQLTGLEGEEAMRAVLDTQEYAALRDVATSMSVTEP